MDLLDILLDPFPARGESLSSGVSDIIFVRDVQIEAKIGPDAWGREKPQPVIISAKIPFSIEQAGKSDDIAHTLDYRTVHKAIRGFSDVDSPSSVQHNSPTQLATRIAQGLGSCDTVRIDLKAPKALLHSEGVLIRLQSGTESGSKGNTHGGIGLAVTAMHIPCIIGIGKHERLQKQPVIVDFAVLANQAESMEKSLPSLFNSVFEIFERSTFLTLEAFVTAIARHLIIDTGFSKAAVSAHKPGVFGMAEGPGVQIVRTKEFFETQKV